MTRQADKLPRVDSSGKYKQNMGIAFCVIYALVYAGFVVISVYDVRLLDTLMPFGVNLATFYGLGLIVFALSLALLYSKLCTVAEKNAAHVPQEGSSLPDSSSDHEGKAKS